MAEYWKSTPKYWCKHCQIYIRDTSFEKTQHEATGKHQGNLKRFLRDIHRNKEREERESQKTKNEVERLRNLVSGRSSTTATASKGNDTTRGPLIASNQATAEDRKKQIAQLAEMGVAVPEEYRRNMALAGQWETISERRITSAEHDDEEAESGKLNIGIRKRKLEKDDEEDEESQILAKTAHRGWGSTTRAYPGVADEDDELDALLSKTTAAKNAGDTVLESADRFQEADDQAEPKSTSNADNSPNESGSAGILKKEEVDTDDSLQVPPLAASDTQALPGIVFKKRRNKAKQ